MRDDGIVTKCGIVVPPASLSWQFTRSGGPGGQHLNTSDTRVELICDLNAVEAQGHVKERLLEALGPEVRIVAASERSQWRNRQIALQRLAVRLDRSARRRPVRRATRPSQGAVNARLADKRHQAERKASRRTQFDE